MSIYIYIYSKIYKLLFVASSLPHSSSGLAVLIHLQLPICEPCVFWQHPHITVQLESLASSVLWWRWLEMKASSCLKWRLSSYLPCTAVYCLDSTTVGISNLAVPSATRNIFGGLHAKASALKKSFNVLFHSQEASGWNQINSLSDVRGCCPIYKVRKIEFKGSRYGFYF